MSNDKTFTAVGITTKNAITKVRFATDAVARQKSYNGLGHEIVLFVDLPSSMGKAEALEWLQANHADKLVGDAAAAVADKLEDLAKVAKRGEVKVQARVAKKAAKSMSAEDLVKAATAE